MNKKWREIFGSEYEYLMGLAASLSDAEAKQSFWEVVMKKKEANPAYSIYDDYPRSETSTKRAMVDCCTYVKNLRRPENHVIVVGNTIEIMANPLGYLTESSMNK